MDVARPVSWAAATWTVPVVPPTAFVLFALTGPPETEQTALGTALAITVAIGLLGVVLARVGTPLLRGVGAGAALGALATAVAVVWMSTL